MSPTFPLSSARLHLPSLPTRNSQASGAQQNDETVDQLPLSLQRNNRVDPKEKRRYDRSKGPYRLISILVDKTCKIFPVSFLKYESEHVGDGGERHGHDEFPHTAVGWFREVEEQHLTNEQDSLQLLDRGQPR